MTVVNGEIFLFLVSDLGLNQPVDEVSGGKIIENRVHLIREGSVSMSAAKFLSYGDFFREVSPSSAFHQPSNEFLCCLALQVRTHITGKGPFSMPLKFIMTFGNVVPVPLGVHQPLHKILSTAGVQVFAVVTGECAL